jgi:hypothetical protein
MNLASKTASLPSTRPSKRMETQKGKNTVVPKARGRPFQPGNPGRPPGARNRTTRLVEHLVDGEAEKIARKLIELATGGNVRCLEIALDRIAPKRSGRPIDFQLPEIKNLNDVVRTMAAVTSGVNDGSLTVEEASHLTRFLAGYANAITTFDLVARVEALEGLKKEHDNCQK